MKEAKGLLKIAYSAVYLSIPKYNMSVKKKVKCVYMVLNISWIVQWDSCCPLKMLSKQPDQHHFSFWSSAMQWICELS